MACEAVYACVVERIAFSMPIASSRMAMMGEAALVVHEALDVTATVPNLSLLMPIKMVAPGTVPSPSFAGAVMTTRLAPAVM